MPRQKKEPKNKAMAERGRKGGKATAQKASGKSPASSPRKKQSKSDE
ncbi:MAG: hypothetical protein ACYDHW_00355 [Syntrophorhabdaceae bacterium]